MSGVGVWCWCGGARGVPCLTHSLCGQHVVDGVVVLLSQDGQFTRLLLFQAFEDGFVVRFGSALQQVVPQGFVLTGLDLARLLELTFDLQLFGLRNQMLWSTLCLTHRRQPGDIFHAP